MFRGLKPGCTIFLAFLMVLSMSSSFAGMEASENDIPQNHMRIHYQREDGNYEELGLWIWEDVAKWSEDAGGWPQGATPFDEEQRTDFGVYLDVEMEENPRRIGFLINDTSGANISEDFVLEIISQEMNELWLREVDGVHELTLIEPVDMQDNTVRVHIKFDEERYEPWGLWIWGDVLQPSEDVAPWPKGAIPLSQEQVGPYGAYVDIEMEEDYRELNFLLVNRETSDQTADMHIADFEATHLFVQQGDEAIYTNPYYVTDARLQYGEVLSDSIMLIFSSTGPLTEEDLKEDLIIVDSRPSIVRFDEVEIMDAHIVKIRGDFQPEKAPYTIAFGLQRTVARPGWRLMDELYAYDGWLGAKLHGDGSATLKVWAPEAQMVSVILYHKEDQYEVLAEDLPMEEKEQGVWEITLDEGNTGLHNLQGYFYHYVVERGGERNIVLDPYAQSMAAWNHDPQDPEKAYPVGKAAIVNPSAIGPELDFAQIEGYEAREDAIIYEVHVRDFTSDPEIEGALHAQFGTFSAFKEKLDYIADLGVTHIQLLPVMSYYFGDELANHERILEYSSTGNTYNWGYDPHGYFSLSGMYSENPGDPELRIEEFKGLIAAIHDQGMGVILDVVYNHTARVHIFEDIVPGYYHFMDIDGTPRTSFGGGRLATTRHMARRILVDSITYWVDEFKVDGFRFDMMGDHDAETIEIAYEKAKELNPNILMIGEGWRTFVGDEVGEDIQPADQDWMAYTSSVGVFSDEIRNELKSGFGHEGEPRFLTGGPRSVEQIFSNIKAQPYNFVTTDPGDVVTYVAAHDNLTLHDVIAVSIQKDPDLFPEEIHQRIRLANAMVLTAQGTAFLHAGQEFGRTKQFRAETPVQPYKSHYGVDAEGEPFLYPYFIHDSYDSSDSINAIDWAKATDTEQYPLHNETREYTQGLIELRRSTNAFRLKTLEEVQEYVTMIQAPEIQEEDVVIGFRAQSTDGTGTYYVFINADARERTFTLNKDLSQGTVLVDANEAGTDEVQERKGFTLTEEYITMDPLTAVIISLQE